MNMWSEVQADKIQPPVYKTRPERPGKLKIRECDKFGHNAMSCKSTTQVPHAFKRNLVLKTCFLYAGTVMF